MLGRARRRWRRALGTRRDRRGDRAERLARARGRGRRASRPTSGKTAPWARARPEHRVRPRGGRPRRCGHRLGAGGRRHQPARRATTHSWPASRPSPVPSWPTSPAAAPTQMVTVRPGVLPAAGDAAPARSRPRRPCDATSGTRGRVRMLGRAARTTTWRRWPGPQVVIGVGTGVAPDEYEALSPLAAAAGRRAGGDPQGHRQGLGAPGPPGRHHGPLHRAAALRRPRR